MTPPTESGTSKKSTKKSHVTIAEASPTDPALWAELVSEIKQAQEAADKAKAKGEQAAVNMFQLYMNLLSVNAKYAWNKIVHKETASDPSTDLQSCSKKGPRELFSQVIHWLRDAPSYHCVLQQCSWAVVLYHKHAQEAPTSQHLSLSVCTACWAA